MNFNGINENLKNENLKFEICFFVFLFFFAFLLKIAIISVGYAEKCMIDVG